MKDKYLKPQADIEIFRIEEVFTNSTGDIQDDDNPVIWPWS